MDSKTRTTIARTAARSSSYKTGVIAALMITALALISCGGGGSGGSTTQSPSGLSYTSPQVFVIGQAITPVSPHVSGTVSSYTVAPALPAGLSLDTTSGVISGTPTAVAAAANYTVTASNSAGTTTATVAITVTDQKASITYGAGALAFTAGIAIQPVVPASTGGAVVSWSVSPALPAGLSLSTSDGSISGTPTASAASANYTVTAQNSGGSSTFTLKITVEAGPVLDLGHADSINVLRMDSTHVLSVDTTGHWNLWNYGTAAKLASGDTQAMAGADMAGATVVLQTSKGFEIRSSADGHVLATLQASVSWWKLAADGTYLSGGNSSGLTVWNTAGQVITSRSGDYSKALVFAAAGELRVAAGAAGQNVIETVSVPAGTSTLSAPFTGQFNTWFLDGERFLTNTSTTVWVYSKTAQQQELTTVPTTAPMGGEGNYFWSVGTNQQFVLYAVGGSSTPIMTALVSPNAILPSANTLLLVGSDLLVIDLSGSSPVSTHYPLPLVAPPVAYAAVSPTLWVTGDPFGVLLDGASLSGTPRFLSYGQAWSIAGGAVRFAVATASGRDIYFDTNTEAQQGSINYPSWKLDISSDGSLLAASLSQKVYIPSNYSGPAPIIYSLPDQTPVNTFTDGLNGLYDFTLSDSGTAFGQTTGTRVVTAVPGGQTIWSDPQQIYGNDIRPIRLSPDGTLIAASDYAEGTRIYKNGTLTSAAAGRAVGWIDNNHLLVDYYGPQSAHPVFQNCRIYDAAGNQLTCPAALPEVLDFKRVTPDSIYWPDQNTILSLTSGTVNWTSGNPGRGVGAVAGSHIVFASGPYVLAESY